MKIRSTMWVGMVVIIMSSARAQFTTPTTVPTGTSAKAAEQARAVDTATVPYARANQPGFSSGLTPISPYGWASGGYAEGDNSPSLIYFTEPDQKTMDEMAEDLNILSLILTRNLEKDVTESGNYKLGIPMLLKGSGHTAAPLYIEGFGAVFNLKVRFPLIASPNAETENQNSGGQSEWEEARRALEGVLDSARVWRGVSDSPPYDAHVVETLKKRTIELLRNASNLRHVPEEDWIVVNVSGPPASGRRLKEEWRTSGSPFGVRPGATTSQFSGGFGGMFNPAAGPVPRLPEEPEAAPDAPRGGALPGASGAGGGRQSALSGTDRSTVITIRIRKSDATALAAKKISEQQFEQEAKTVSYLAPLSPMSRAGGGGGGSGGGGGRTF